MRLFAATTLLVLNSALLTVRIAAQARTSPNPGTLVHQSKILHHFSHALFFFAIVWITQLYSLYPHLAKRLPSTGSIT